MTVHEMIGKIATTVVFCRIVALYDLVTSLVLDAENLSNFAKKVQSSFSPHVRFNGATRSHDMLQAVHYFNVKGLGGRRTAPTLEAWLSSPAPLLRIVAILGSRMIS